MDSTKNGKIGVTYLAKIHIGEYVDAPKYAEDGCRLIGIWDEMVWLELPKHGGTTVVPIDSVVPHQTKVGHSECIIVNLKNNG